jgi:hypothetical protein
MKVLAPRTFISSHNGSHILSRTDSRAFFRRKIVPLRMPIAGCDHAVHFHHAVDMADSKTQCFGGTQNGGRRSRTSVIISTGRGSLAPLASAPSTTKFRTVGGATHVRHVVPGYGIEDGIGRRPVQTDMCASGSGSRPREAPAVAVKHRRGPQINRGAADVERQQLTQRIQVGAAMMVHGALGIAGRT